MDALRSLEKLNRERDAVVSGLAHNTANHTDLLARECELTAKLDALDGQLKRFSYAPGAITREHLDVLGLDEVFFEPFIEGFKKACASKLLSLQFQRSETDTALRQCQDSMRTNAERAADLNKQLHKLNQRTAEVVALAEQTLQRLQETING
jgi:hypothetical protein